MGRAPCDILRDDRAAPCGAPSSFFFVYQPSGPPAVPIKVPSRIFTPRPGLLLDKAAARPYVVRMCRSCRERLGEASCSGSGGRELSEEEFAILSVMLE